MRYWEKYEPVYIGYRERFEHPPKGQVGEWFEDMYYVLKKIQIEDRKDVATRVARRKQIRDTLNKTMNPP